jgi:lysozyme family protein
MKKNFDHCLELLLSHEGGFVNHPKDPGGMTNLGVTRADIRAVCWSSE